MKFPVTYSLDSVGLVLVDCRMFNPIPLFASKLEEGSLKEALYMQCILNMLDEVLAYRLKERN